MSRKFILYFTKLLVFACLVGCQSDDGAVPEPPEAAGPTQILMVGNSHTFYFDLPDVVKRLAESQGDTVDMHTLTKGGAGFRDHVEGNFNQDIVQGELWDYVVLQEAGGLASREMAYMEAESYPFAKTLVNWIQSNSQATKIYFYLTHAYRDGAPWCDTDPNVCNFDDMLDEIRRNYIYFEDNTSGQVSPAGIIWKVLRNQNPGIDLHDPDTIHPNQLGSYVSACAIYVSIFQKPLTTDAYLPEGIESEMAGKIYEVVNAMILDEIPNWKEY